MRNLFIDLLKYLLFIMFYAINQSNVYAQEIINDAIWDTMDKNIVRIYISFSEEKYDLYKKTQTEGTDIEFNFTDETDKSSSSDPGKPILVRFRGCEDHKCNFAGLFKLHTIYKFILPFDTEFKFHVICEPGILTESETNKSCVPTKEYLTMPDLKNDQSSFKIENIGSIGSARIFLNNTEGLNIEANLIQDSNKFHYHLSMQILNVNFLMVVFAVQQILVCTVNITLVFWQGFTHLKDLILSYSKCNFTCKFLFHLRMNL